MNLAQLRRGGEIFDVCYQWRQKITQNGCKIFEVNIHIFPLLLRKRKTRQSKIEIVEKEKKEMFHKQVRKKRERKSIGKKRNKDLFSLFSFPIMAKTYEKELEEK